MQSYAREQFEEAREETFTVWYNPLDVEQRAFVWYGSGHRGGNEPRPTRIRFPAKQETQVQSRFDDALQVVHCAEDSCRKLPGSACRDPLHHDGVVVGGLCPQLVRKGQVAKLSPVLNPALAELEQTKAQLAASDLARKGAENAQVIAEARRQELEAELAKRKDSELDAATRPDAKAPSKK